MNKDQMSAWLDGELEETEIEALLADFANGENPCGRYHTYTLIGAAMRGQCHPPSLGDHEKIEKVCAALDNEEIPSASLIDRMKNALSPDRLMETFRGHWLPVVAAILTFSAVAFYPMIQGGTTDSVGGAPMRSIAAAASNVEDAKGIIENFIEGHVDEYLTAHQQVSPLVVSHRGGLGTLRSVLYADPVVAQ